MPQGLQVWDGNGNLRISITDRLAKVIGTISINSNGYMTLPEIQGNSYFFLFIPSSYNFNVNDVYPSMIVSGRVLSWTYTPGDMGAGSNVAGILLYGAF